MLEILRSRLAEAQRKLEQLRVMAVMAAGAEQELREIVAAAEAHAAAPAESESK